MLTVYEDTAFRNTSTDVEKTWAKRFLTIVARKHLHGRGEDFGRGSINQSFILPRTAGGSSDAMTTIMERLQAFR